MGFGNYLKTLRKLNNMGRWANEHMHQRATVSEHTFSVLQIGQVLGMLEEQRGNLVNWRALFSKLLNHDVTEALTGDILSYIKHKTPKMREAVDTIERELVEEYLISSMVEPYKEVFRHLLFDGKDQTVEGKILRAADYIDSLIECILEVELGNYNPFEQKFYDILDSLRQVELSSVKVFIQETIPELIAGIDRLEI